MKCPYCNEELKICNHYTDGTSQLRCDKCNLFGDNKLFEDLIKTEQALDKAIWWLNEIVESHRCTPISTAEMALAEMKQIVGE